MINEITLGAAIDRYWTLREERRQLAARDKELIQEITALKEHLFAKLDEQGVFTAQSQRARITLTEKIVPRIDDWDALYAYIKAHDAFYLLQRRPTATVFQELFETGQQIPGAHPISLKDISLTTL